MLTFSGPFTVCINFIEAVGLEGIHEKIYKGIEEQKQWVTAHFSFSVTIEILCCDRDFRLPVVTETDARLCVLGRRGRLGACDTTLRSRGQYEDYVVTENALSRQ